MLSIRRVPKSRDVVDPNGTLSLSKRDSVPIQVHRPFWNKDSVHFGTDNVSIFGFTYIELIITLAVIAICFVPLTRMFSRNIEETVYLGNLVTAMGLARQEMEKTKNLAFTEKQIEDMGDIRHPEIIMNDISWHVERDIIDGTDPLEVRVRVYREGGFDKPMVELVTLFEDLR